MFGSLCPGGPTEAEDDGSIPIRGTGAGVANGIPGIPANIVKVSKFRRCGVVVIMQIGLPLLERACRGHDRGRGP